MEIAERLKRLRESAHYSQEDAAALLGISSQEIIKWESGQKNPEINDIIRLTQIYKVSADYILLGEDNKMTADIHHPKQVSRTFQIILTVLICITGIAIITVLFILALGFLSANKR